MVSRLHIYSKIQSITFHMCLLLINIITYHIVSFSFSINPIVCALGSNNGFITSTNISSCASVHYDSCIFLYACQAISNLIPGCFFSLERICSSHSGRKTIPPGWIGSQVIWQRICQLGIWVYVLGSEIAFRTIGGRLSVFSSVMCLSWGVCVVWEAVAVCFRPLQDVEADPHTHHFSCLYGTKQSYLSSLCVVHTLCSLVFLFPSASALCLYGCSEVQQIRIFQTNRTSSRCNLSTAAAAPLSLWKPQ